MSVGICGSYTTTVRRARVGWFASVVWHPATDIIGLEGPSYWRPTRRWVTARANAHLRRQLAARDRDAAAANYTTRYSA